MQTFRRGTVLASALTALALAVTGCHSGGSGGGPSTEGGVPVLNAADNVASVKGQNITQRQFFTQMQNYAVNPQNPAAALPVGRSVLQQMITQAAFIQMAKDQNAAPTDAEVGAQYDNLKLVQGWGSIRPVEQLIADSGLTPDDVKDMQIRPQLAQIKLLTKGAPAPTDAQVRSYYDQHKADPPFTKPERAHVRAIVLANQTDAQDISRQIKGGQSFDTFVPRSLNKAFVNGEVPQWVPLDSTKNVQLGPLIKAVKSVGKGQTSPPLQFNGGWWLIQVVDIAKQEVVPFDTVKGLIPYLLMEQSVQPLPTDSPAAQQEKIQKQQGLQTQVRDYEQKLAGSGDIKVTLPGTQYTQMLTELKSPPPPSPAMMAPPGGPTAPVPMPAPSAPRGRPARP